MASIGRKLKTKGVIITLLSLVLMNIGCEDKIDTPVVNPSERKTVEVALNIGFADEDDGAMLSAGTKATDNSDGNKQAAFDMQLIPASQTRAGATTVHPDNFYNLAIHQYSSTGLHLASATNIAEKAPGTIIANLANSNDCQLLIIARGATGAVVSLANKSLSEAQKIMANTDIIKAIDATDGTNINNMPYLLFLPHVKIESGKLVSPEGTDVRLLLKRLAVGVTIDWMFSKEMENKNYTLSEVRLIQVPKDYRILPETETDPTFGVMYPTSVSEFVDGFRLKGNDLTAIGGTQTFWMPANARGIRNDVTYPTYRNKNYAHSAATYVEFVVNNTEKNERLLYRAYLGGNTTNDFNLLENTNYHWTININTDNYTSDQRIQLQDLSPVISSNLQTTSNCFMMLPSTNICFNPYKHEAGEGGWNTYLAPGGIIAADKQITKVEVLWQTKDAGTSGDLVMGYAASDDIHTNLVNFVDNDNINNVRVHVKVPNTNGGNAVIAAKNSSNEIVWSWHLWISDYVPVRINGYGEYEEAQAKTQNGTVHKYRSDLFKEGKKYANCVMMDRDLGAVAGGYPAIYKGENYTVRNNVETQGFLYQGARKDPLFISADGTTNEVDVIYNGNGVSLGITNIDPGKVSNKYEYSIQHPLHYIYGEGGIGSGVNKWDNNGKKAIDDPCPNGWRVPLFDGTKGSSDFSGSIFDGFQTGGSISGSGNNAEYIISSNNEFSYSSYFFTDRLIDKAPDTNVDENPRGGRLYYLGTNKQVEKTIHNTVWFPVSAERVYTTGKLNAPLYAHIWFANNANGNFMFGSGMKPNAMRVIRYGMGYGWPVRCIQYNKE